MDSIKIGRIGFSPCSYFASNSANLRTTSLQGSLASARQISSGALSKKNSHLGCGCTAWMNVFLMSGSESIGKFLKTDAFHSSSDSLASKPSRRGLKSISGSRSFLPLSELKSSKSAGCPIKSGMSLGEVTSHKVKTGFSSRHSGYSSQSARSTSNGVFGFSDTARFVFWQRDFANCDKSAESSVGSLGSGLDSFIALRIQTKSQSQDQHQAAPGVTLSFRQLETRQLRYEFF